jgi:hypothetical protein
MEIKGAAALIETVGEKVGWLWNKLKGFWGWLTGKGGSEPSTGGGVRNALGLARHATGGILTRPHLGMVAEAGPEAIIPLDGSRRAVSLWEKTGQLLGVGGSGGIVVNINAPFSPTINGAGAHDLKDQQNRYMADLEATVRRVLREVAHNNNRLAFS